MNKLTLYKRLMNRLIPMSKGSNQLENTLQRDMIELGIFFGMFTSLNYFFLSVINSNIVDIYISLYAISVILLTIVVQRKYLSPELTVNFALLFLLPSTLHRNFVYGGIDSPMILIWNIYPILAVTFFRTSLQFLWVFIFIAIATTYKLMADHNLMPLSSLHISQSADLQLISVILTQLFILTSIYYYRKMSINFQNSLREKINTDVQLIRTLSHDISNPLTIIMNYGKILTKKSDKFAEMYKDSENIFETLNSIKKDEAFESGKLQSSKNRMIISDPEAEMQIKIFRFVIYSVICIFTFFAIFYALSGQIKIAKLQMTIVFAASISLLIERYTKSRVIAAGFVMIFASFSAFTRMKLMGGFTSAAIFMWPLSAICVCSFLPINWSFFWICIYALISLYYYTQFKLGHIFETTVTIYGQHSFKLVAFIVTQFALLFLVRHLRKIHSQYIQNIAFLKSKKEIVLKKLTRDISGPINDLEKKFRDLESTEYKVEIGKITKACQQINDLIKSLSKNEQGHSQNNSQFTLKEAFDEVIFSNSEKLQNKRINFSIQSDIEPELIVLEGIKSIFAFEILNNIITNAIKFSPENNNLSNEIIISVKIIDEKLELTIKDHGIGIPSEILKNLFNPNVMTSRRGTSGEEGTGFGMPILKQYIEKFHGTIEVESKSIDEFPENHGTLIKTTFSKFSLLNN